MAHSPTVRRSPRRQESRPDDFAAHGTPDRLTPTGSRSPATCSPESPDGPPERSRTDHSRPATLRRSPAQGHPDRRKAPETAPAARAGVSDFPETARPTAANESGTGNHGTLDRYKAPSRHHRTGTAAALHGYTLRNHPEWPCLASDLPTVSFVHPEPCKASERKIGLLLALFLSGLNETPEQP